MKKIALVFPGQGSQYVGMGREFYDAYPAAKEIFDRANEVLGYDIKKIIFEGPDETLRQTEYTQPAVFTASAACLKIFSTYFAIDHSVSFSAGHSLGEYTALYSAGVFDFETGLRLVKKRAEFIRDASIKNPGTMAAVIGLDEKKLLEICSATGVEAVNFNSPGQVVIAGRADAINSAATLAKESGAIKVVLLNVSGAFHSSLMREAAANMSQELQNNTLKDAVIPVVMNCDARATTDAVEIKNKLVTQIDHPVLWEKSVKTMVAAGVSTFMELGPGRVLSGLIKRIDKKAAVFNVEDEKSLKHAVENLSE